MMIKDDILVYPEENKSEKDYSEKKSSKKIIISDDFKKDERKEQQNKYDYFDEIDNQKKKKKIYDSEEDINQKRKKKARQRKRFRIIVWVILLLFLVVSVSLDVMLYLANKNQEEVIKNLNKINEQNSALLEEYSSEKYITKEDAQKAIEDGKATVKQDLKNEVLRMFENGDGILKILETVYSDKVVVPDNSGYFFYDIEEDIAKHGLDFSKFQYPDIDEESGEKTELTYVEDGVTVKTGIDVSKFQGDINWSKVKKDGIEFAFIRCGYRGYETGKIVEDEKFEDNIKGCNEVGLDAGVYFFTEAISEAEGIEEAEYVLNLLEEYEVSVQLPIVVDLEQSANVSKSRTTNISQEDRTKIIIAFCERIKEAGYEPMIYGNLKSHMRMTDIHELEGYKKWFAYYRTPLRYPYKFDIWQYTAAGSVDGIKGDVDMNIAFFRE